MTTDLPGGHSLAEKDKLARSTAQGRNTTEGPEVSGHPKREATLGRALEGFSEEVALARPGESVGRHSCAGLGVTQHPICMWGRDRGWRPPSSERPCDLHELTQEEEAAGLHAAHSCTHGDVGPACLCPLFITAPAHHGQ